MRISDWSSDVCSSDLGGLNPFEGLTSVLCVKSVHAAANAQDFLGLNLNVRRHALSTASRLLNHDSRIGQRHSHPRLTRSPPAPPHSRGLPAPYRTHTSHPRPLW